MTEPQNDTPKLAYRLLTGPDDITFCERVSAALADGYVLYGSPSATFNSGGVIVAQAVVLPGVHPNTLPNTTANPTGANV